MNHPLNILYEDNQILVCEKPSGIAVQSRRIGTADMESLLKIIFSGKVTDSVLPIWQSSTDWISLCAVSLYLRKHLSAQKS